MAVDKLTNKWLVTGDVDGLIKVWNISNYAVEPTGTVITTTPRKLNRSSVGLV